jgi:hypothetical protein
VQRCNETRGPMFGEVLKYELLRKECVHIGWTLYTEISVSSSLSEGNCCAVLCCAVDVTVYRYQHIPVAMAHVYVLFKSLPAMTVIKHLHWVKYILYLCNLFLYSYYI